MKTIDDYFIDFEANNIGYGYGSGEKHTTAALKGFLAKCPDSGAYDYEIIEQAIGGAATWFLIPILAKAGIIDYGTSPRYAWLTDQGKALKAYLDARPIEQLLQLLQYPESQELCYPGHCNCGEGDCRDGNSFAKKAKRC